MILIENVEVFNIRGAIRAMRNPLDSWDRSDSMICRGDFFQDCKSTCKECPRKDDKFEDDVFCVGSADLELMHKLYVAGHPHRKYLRQIFVSMDITAPSYFMSQFDTYKVGVTRNSCSFMHKGLSEPFNINNFSIHNKDVQEILNPLEKKQYELVYPYDTDEYRDYICENGRKYKIFKNGKIVAYRHEYTDSYGRHRIFEESECKPSRTKYGYFELNIGGRTGEKWLVHRLVANVWCNNESNFSTVNHIDGNKGNNCAENLEWVSLQDNIRHGFDNGLYDNCSSLRAKYISWKSGHTVVNPFEKSEILYDYRVNKLTHKQISEKYGIPYKQTNNIICQKSALDSDTINLFLLCYTWESMIDELNRLRDVFNETKDPHVFQEIRDLLPSGYNIKSTITCSYENIVNMIEWRSNHRLVEWKEFCETMLKELPYLKEILGK